MAALISVGAYLHFPLGPVPISMQPSFVLVSGYILGSYAGFLSVALYMLAGLIGLPVFSGGTAGLGHLFGPTGGYLFGFLITPLITGSYFKLMLGVRLSWLSGCLFGFLGYIPVYLIGIVWLKTILGIAWLKAVSIGMFPFLISDILQIFVSTGIGRYVQKYSLGLSQALQDMV
jgi:biotin transport system substrate-specific component